MDTDDLEGKDLVLNDSFNIRIQFQSRVKNQPLRFLEARSPHEIQLAECFLRLLREAESGSEQDDFDFPAELVEVATRVGLLVAPSDRPTQATSYRCDLDEQLLPFVPAAVRREYPLPADGNLVKNDRIVLQTDADLPPQLVGKVAIDSSLWRHLGERFRVTPIGLADDRPIVWVENPSTTLFEPMWCGGTWGHVLRSFVVGELSIGDLPQAARRMLSLANVLVDPAQTQRYRSADRLTDAGDYSVISGLLSPLQLAAVRRHFRRLREAGWFQLDNKHVVDKRDGAYCDVVSLFLQSLVMPLISALVLAPIKPSYTWVYRYRPGAVLERHTDRPQCRWNVSLCIDIEGDDQEAPWPFYLESSAGPQSVNLEIGDAVIYRGTETPHWRDALPSGRFVTVCLFHFVDASFDGPLR